VLVDVAGAGLPQQNQHLLVEGQGDVFGEGPALTVNVAQGIVNGFEVCTRLGYLQSLSDLSDAAQVLQRFGGVTGGR